MKMNKNKEYWIKRLLIQDKLLQKNIFKVSKDLRKAFEETRREIKKELALLYAGDLEYTQSEKYRLEASLSSLNNVIDNLYYKEEELVTNSLKLSYTYIYEDNVKILLSNQAFNTINDRLVEMAVKSTWSGLTFSERIWNNRDRLAIVLKEELTKGLQRGDSLQDMARILADKLNAQYNNALTLVHTETCFIQNQATIDSYKAADVKEYEFVAFIDNRTSPECKDLDGQIFKVSEAQAGVNLSPMHCRCRSCCIPIVD